MQVNPTETSVIKWNTGTMREIIIAEQAETSSFNKPETFNPTQIIINGEKNKA